MFDIEVVTGWSAVEWDFGARVWVEVHDDCLEAYLNSREDYPLSDIDGVAASYAEAYPLKCAHCGKG